MTRFKDDKEKYRVEYGKIANELAKKQRAKRNAIPQVRHKNSPLPKLVYNPVKFQIQPTIDNLKGTDKDEPIICNEFGCATPLTPEQQLYNKKCYACQCKVKIDPTKFISHPIKQSA